LAIWAFVRPLGVFFAGGAFFPALGFGVAMWARRAPIRGFWVGTLRRIDCDLPIHAVYCAAIATSHFASPGCNIYLSGLEAHRIQIKSIRKIQPLVGLSLFGQPG
jgi:hypothetical protein